MCQAANPGCILEDFVRWHSPPDWMETEGKAEFDTIDLSSTRGQLSSRMQKEGGTHSSSSISISTLLHEIFIAFLTFIERGYYIHTLQCRFALLLEKMMYCIVRCHYLLYISNACYIWGEFLKIMLRLILGVIATHEIYEMHNDVRCILCWCTLQPSPCGPQTLCVLRTLLYPLCLWVFLYLLDLMGVGSQNI
jgi:hypothetical protein